MSLVHDHSNTIPPSAPMFAGLLVAFSIALAVAVRLGFAPHSAVPTVERTRAHVPMVEQRLLSFTDQADGSVLVVDARNSTPVATIAGEKQGGGFIRGVMRGLARDRRMRGMGSAAPFQLTLWRDGDLSLTDTATGRQIELGGFGPDNRAAFAQFLKHGGVA
jgi:putative photosynthetic complex assembly protein